jgi:MOSC domain-containing protein YiiM
VQESPPRRVLRLWTRAASRAPTEDREALELTTGQGVVGDHTFGSKRHVTLIFEDDWKAATAALGRDVDPSARRANVLLSGGDGLALIGQRIRLGDCLLEIRGETRPCFVMDEAVEGLKDALAPDGRAGIWGVVLEGGSVTTTAHAALEG